MIDMVGCADLWFGEVMLRVQIAAEGPAKQWGFRNVVAVRATTDWKFNCGNPECVSEYFLQIMPWLCLKCCFIQLPVIILQGFVLATLFAQSVMNNLMMGFLRRDFHTLVSSRRMKK